MRVKKLLLYIGLLSAFLKLPSSAYAEKIDNFSSQIFINKEGIIDVSERIDYNFEDVYRHGIFRNIPTIKKNTAGKKFRLDYSAITVTDENNRGYQWSKSYDNDQLQIKIGDPNQTITSTHTYIIKYQITGALTYFSDHDELYWNITGNDWNIPIDKVTGVLSIQGYSSAKDYKIDCFTGPALSQDKNCTIKPQNNKVTFTTTSSFNPNEGLTIVVGFPKNIVAVLEPREVISFWETLVGKITASILKIIVIIGALFWYIFYPIKIIWKWYRYGRDPKSPIGVASSWYDPPKTNNLRLLTPGETGTLIDEKADMEDISATIVDLARRGYLRIIEKTKKDFYLEKTKKFTNDLNLQPFEKKLLSGIFTDSDSVRIKDAQLIDTVTDTQKLLYKSVVRNGFFTENPETIRKFYTVIGSIAIFTLNIPLSLIAFIFGRNMPRKTADGAQAANIARSLKNFLSSQDRQLEFQARNQLFFERLLPFAVAFGVEKIWAERFKDINFKSPTWYQGYGNNTFTSYYLVSSLNSSFSSFQSAATPTSSSSGFSSGFSGGSSGGGGGGGGGGSW